MRSGPHGPIFRILQGTFLENTVSVMKPLWYLGFILVLERFSVFIFQDLRAFQQLEFNYII